jgi:hypothetical protein
MSKASESKHPAKGDPKEHEEATSEVPKCFLIMPISDPDGYEKGHFTRVYLDIFKPACEQAGYEAIRADEHSDTGMIHVDILRRLLDSPLAICDLSSRNPNVLFELGLRQAFDKPTVLVQEVGTPRIFDVNLLRTIEYRKELRYSQVLDDQKLIVKTIRATVEEASKGKGMSSLVRLLELSGPAKLKEGDGSPSEMFKVVMARMGQMSSDIINLSRMAQGPTTGGLSKKEVAMSAAELGHVRISLSAVNSKIKQAKVYLDHVKHLLETATGKDESEARSILEEAQEILKWLQKQALKDSWKSEVAELESMAESLWGRFDIPF